MRRSGGVRLVVRTIAVIMMVAGVATTGYSALDWWRRVDQVRAAQAALDRAHGELAAGGSIANGEPIARMHLPTLRLSLVVVEGDDEASLRRGPGRIPSTSTFGSAGNTGVAGHRYPGVFWDLDKLGVGDPVVVETRDTWLVYRIVSGRVVGPKHTSVLDGPPAGAASLLTLVTCDPKFSTANRLIRQGSLVRVTPRSAGVPGELGPKLWLAVGLRGF